MPLIREKKVGDKPYYIHELEVAKVREWLKNTAENQSMDLLDCMLFDDINLSDIPFFTSLTAADLEELTPSQIATVVDEIKVVNPHFFVLRGHLVAMGRTLTKTQAGASGISNEPLQH